MLAIRSAHLFDRERFASGPATVIVDRATIVRVERSWPDLPAEIAVLDVGEATVLPGLVDTHVHLVADSGVGALDRVAGYTAQAMTRVVAESPRQQLAGGVTTARDLGDWDWVAVDHRHRQREERAVGGGRQSVARERLMAMWQGGRLSATRPAHTVPTRTDLPQDRSGSHGRSHDRGDAHAVLRDDGRRRHRSV